MTEVSFLAVPSRAESSLAFRIVGNSTAAMPAAPIWTKLRRLMPSQYAGVFPASIRNMAGLLSESSGRAPRGRGSRAGTYRQSLIEPDCIAVFGRESIVFWQLSCMVLWVVGGNFE